MKLTTLCIALCLPLVGCTDTPVNGTVVIHITDNGIVASCESTVYNGNTGSQVPAVCSQTKLIDERIIQSGEATK